MKLILSLKTPAQSFFKVWDCDQSILFKTPKEIVLHKAKQGIQLVSTEKLRSTGQSGNIIDLTLKQLQQGALIEFGMSSKLKILSIPDHGLDVNIHDLKLDRSSTAVERANVRKPMLMFVSSLIFAFVISLIIPKPKEEELIPEKFNKLIMVKQRVVMPKSESVAQSSAPATKGGKTSTQTMTVAAQDAKKVVQALKSKALQNSIKGLLKGGMTGILQTSAFQTGADQTSLANRMIASVAPVGNIATSISDSALSKGSVKVASVGGSGIGNGGSGGVGYGKGDRAGVAGQGKGYIGIESEGSSVDEGLSKEEVARVIHQHLSEIRYCHETSMLKTVQVEGRLFLGFTIASNGLVSIANVKESSVNNGWLEDCVMRKLKKWEFPKPKGGVDVAISYPFIFKNLGK